MEEKMNNVEQVTEEKNYDVEKKGLFSKVKMPTGKQVLTFGKRVGVLALAGVGGYLLGKNSGSKVADDSTDEDIVYIIEPSDEQ